MNEMEKVVVFEQDHQFIVGIMIILQTMAFSSVVLYWDLIVIQIIIK